MGEEENSCQQERIFRFWEQAQIIVHLAFYYSLILIGDFPFYLFIYLFIYLFFGSNFKIPPFLVIWMLSREPSILKVSVHFSMPLQSPTRLPVVSLLPQLSCSCYFSGIKLLRGVRKCPSDCSLCTKSLDIFYISSKNMFKIVIVHICKQFLSFKC